MYIPGAQKQRVTGLIDERWGPVGSVGCCPGGFKANGPHIECRGRKATSEKEQMNVRDCWVLGLVGW